MRLSSKPGLLVDAFKSDMAYSRAWRSKHCAHKAGFLHIENDTSLWCSPPYFVPDDEAFLNDSPLSSLPKPLFQRLVTSIYDITLTTIQFKSKLMENYPTRISAGKARIEFTCLYSTCLTLRFATSTKQRTSRINQDLVDPLFFPCQSLSRIS